MDIVVANLYKRFQAGSSPKLDENTFSLIGHFDYLQFRIAPFKSLSEQYGNRDVQKNIHPAWAGFHSQSMYLLRFPDVDRKDMKSLISNTDEAYPFCVMATIEDSNQFNITEQPFSADDVLKKLSDYRDIYVKKFQDFIEYRGVETGFSAKMEVFFTLSCIDTVLLFRTNSFSLIHDFIFELYMKGDRLMSYTMYGVKVGYNLAAHSGAIAADDDLRLSMRILFNPSIHLSGMQQIDNLIRTLTNNKPFSSIPAGRHHYLYYITEGVYNVLDACLDVNGQLSLSNPKNEYSKYVNGHRFTLSFMDNALVLKYPRGHNENVPDGDSICDATHSVYLKFKALNEYWEGHLKNAPNAYEVIIADLKAYAITVENTAREYMYFFACMDNHTRHMINRELSTAIIEPLKKLEQMILDFQEYAVRLLDNDVYYAINMYRRFLDQIQTVITKFGDQVGDIIHMQQNRMEDRGVYRNDVSATAKLCLGYYSYARLLSDALFATDKDGVTHSVDNPFSFYINLETMSDPVNATEHFSNVLDYQHQNDFPTKGALVGIDVSRQSVSNIFSVKASITHEIAHFVGWRNREFRAECIIKSVSRLLSLSLIPNLHCKDTAEDIVKDFYRERKKEIEQAAETTRVDFVNQVSKRILDVFRESLDNDLVWAFQKNCEDILISILQCWLDSPDEEGKPDEIIKKHYLDIPSLAVNLNVELNQKWSEIAFDWIRENSKDPNNVVTHWYEDLAGPVYSFNRAIMLVKAWIDSLIGGEVYSPSSFRDVQYNEKTERLDLRLSVIPSEKEDERILKRPVSPEKESLSSFVHAICNAYSEAYCDLVMVKLLHLSAKQYIEYLYQENRMENDACWRIWSVLKTAYDFSTLENDVKRKIIAIRKNAGSYRYNDEVMQEYLKSIIDDPDMRSLFDCKPGYFIPSDDNDAEDSNILYLYTCYLRLHG